MRAAPLGEEPPHARHQRRQPWPSSPPSPWRPATCNSALRTTASATPRPPPSPRSKTAEAALEKAEAAQAESLRQIARNEALLALARKSLDRYETLSKSDLLASYGMESLRSDLLEAAVEFYDALAAQTDQTEVSRQDRGEALFRLAGAHWQLGRMDAARHAYEQAIAQFQQLADGVPRQSCLPARSGGQRHQYR